MYAEDRAKCLLTWEELNTLSKLFNAPDWFIQAVENQKIKWQHLEKQ